jgi:hypothetical protein
MFRTTVQPENLCVISVPIASIPKITWFLMREFCRKKREKKQFISLLLDDDGLSLVCDPSAIKIIELLLNKDEFKYSPQMWRAFIIDVSGSAYELPGAVCYLASVLSKEGLSILHIATFESEVFLIQENDVQKAQRLLKELRDSPKSFELLERTYEANNFQRLGNASGNLNFNCHDPLESSNDNDNLLREQDSNRIQVDQSWIAPNYKLTRKSHVIESPSSANKVEFTLCVLPNHVMLARLSDDYDFTHCSNVIVSLKFHFVMCCRFCCRCRKFLFTYFFFNSFKFYFKKK